MVTATPDKTEKSKTTADSSELSMTSSSSVDSVTHEANITDIHYYYASGDFHFILDRSFKPETLESTELTPVPFMPEWHSGIMSIHGIIMPVIDVSKFTKTQQVKVNSEKQSRPYLLKLEHPEFRPIVFKIDALPQAINIKKFKSLDPDKASPAWIKKQLVDETLKLAVIDHQKLFEQIINLQ